MKFKTQSGSLYEIDFWKRSVRRLNGIADPTPRQGPDGEWKTYSNISIPVVGQGVAINWNVPGQYTVTSPVAELVEETQADESFFKMFAASVGGMASC